VIIFKNIENVVIFMGDYTGRCGLNGWAVDFFIPNFDDGNLVTWDELQCPRKSFCTSIGVTNCYGLREVNDEIVVMRGREVVENPGENLDVEYPLFFYMDD